MLKIIFRKKNFYFVSAGLAVLLILSLSPILVSAQESTQKIETLNELENLAANVGLKKETDLVSIIGTVVNSLLSLLGIVFIVLIIYGGLKWMTSAGNEEQVKKARGVLINAVIGLAIVLLAYAIANFVISELIKAT